jgi:Zn-dependent M28 family amino/carboxypeptidase
MPKPNRRRRPWALMAVLAILMCSGQAFCGRSPAASPAFDGGRAFEDLKKLVSFGPRPPGSKALAESREWILRQLKATGAKVDQDAFTASTPKGDIPLVNIIAKFPGKRDGVIMLAGHYDTALKEGFRFVGANDGGSSAAFLLEMARVLAARQNDMTYWVVFFDGEEALQQWSQSDSLYGSRHLVQQLTAQGELARIQAMILVDMIADAHLDIHKDDASTPWLRDMFFKKARELGYGKNFPESPQAVDDDHIPFVDAGVSAVDLIDLDYGPHTSAHPNGAYWHTAQDTVEHCSPYSLTIVGRVVVATLDELEKSPRVN